MDLDDMYSRRDNTSAFLLDRPSCAITDNRINDDDGEMKDIDFGPNLPTIKPATKAPKANYKSPKTPIGESEEFASQSSNIKPQSSDSQTSLDYNAIDIDGDNLNQEVAPNLRETTISPDKDFAIIDSEIKVFIVSNVLDKTMLVLKCFGQQAVEFINSVNTLFRQGNNLL
jgi:hypothetical protein